MRRQVLQLTRLSNDLLDVASCARGNLSICRASIDVQRAIQSACEEIRPYASRCGHKMSVALGDQPITVFGDASRLTQVFANVLQNSAKFTNRGGHLSISLDRDGDTAVIRLCDDGRGLCADHLRNIFEVDPSEKKCSEVVGAGLGIGLRLAKSIVELHGGSIEAFSEGLGHGCTVLVKLPTKIEMLSTSSNSSPKTCETELLRL